MFKGNFRERETNKWSPVLDDGLTPGQTGRPTVGSKINVDELVQLLSEILQFGCCELLH
jgi:hypothetical protein